MNSADNAEIPPGISEEEIEAHIMGVLMIVPLYVIINPTPMGIPRGSIWHILRALGSLIPMRTRYCKDEI